MSNKTDRADNLGFLVARAAATIVLVLGLLLGLRLSGVTCMEQDATIQMVERVTQTVSN